MKKTCLVLASLVAILLLSCSSFDSSNSSAEDVNYSPAQALQKVIPNDEAQQTCYVYTYTIPSLGSTITTSSTTATSHEYCFTPIGIPTNATVTGIELNIGTMTYTGAVLTNYWQMRKGSKITPLLGGGAGSNVTITINCFNGEPANDIYCVSVNVTCVGFGTASYCSKLYSNVKLTIHYCVP